jgi:hypothetical protein
LWQWLRWKRRQRRQRQLRRVRSFSGGNFKILLIKSNVLNINLDAEWDGPVDWSRRQGAPLARRPCGGSLRPCHHFRQGNRGWEWQHRRLSLLRSTDSLQCWRRTSRL